MTGGVVRGVVGQIKWSYYVAASVEGYTVTRSKADRWSLRARVVLADKYKLSQKPLVFAAPHKKGCWYWPIRDIEIREGTVTATLGAPLP